MSLDILTPKHAELEIQSNEDFLIFNGTLFLAFIVGMVELLPVLKKAKNMEKKMLSILYFVFCWGESS